MKLAGKVLLVTGAGSGMGRAHAVKFAEHGCHVVVNDLLEETAAATVGLLDGGAGQHMAVAGDISDSAVVARMVQQTMGRFGRIDFLINNAGIDDGAHPLETIDDQRLERMLAIHLKGSFYCCRAVVPHMKARRSGKIVNISSIWGMVGGENAAHYCAAKAGILGLTKALARELVEWHINVNAIAPGAIRTAMMENKYSPEVMQQKGQAVPWRRLGEPEEVAALALYLCADEAEFITGQCISPNGGQIIVGI